MELPQEARCTRQQNTDTEQLATCSFRHSAPNFRHGQNRAAKISEQIGRWLLFPLPVEFGRCSKSKGAWTEQAQVLCSSEILKLSFATCCAQVEAVLITPFAGQKAAVTSMQNQQIHTTRAATLQSLSDKSACRPVCIALHNVSYEKRFEPILLHEVLDWPQVHLALGSQIRPLPTYCYIYYSPILPPTTPPK